MAPRLCAWQHQLAAGACRVPPLRWYIMTSPATDADTKKHFRDHAFFGLRESQVTGASWGGRAAWGRVTHGHS